MGAQSDRGRGWDRREPAAARGGSRLARGRTLRPGSRPIPRQTDSARRAPELGPEVQEGIDVSVVLEFLEVAEVFLSHRLGDAVLGPPPIENLGQALERLGNPAALL